MAQTTTCAGPLLVNVSGPRALLVFSKQILLGRAAGFLLTQHTDDLRLVEPAFPHSSVSLVTDSHSNRGRKKGAGHN